MRHVKQFRSSPLNGRQTAGIVFATALLSACATCCGPRDNSPPPPDSQGKKSASSLNNAQSCLDGVRAIEHIKKIVKFGDRHVGTPGAKQTRDYIVQQLQSYGLKPVRHPFTAYTPHPQFPQVEMENITVSIAGRNPDPRILIGGHFDGKILDGISFKGANDGGSSTALLLEMARCLITHPPVFPVELAFLDGEEALVEWSDSDSVYGSKNLAAELKASGDDKKYAAAVIVDMIGDVDLELVRETHSNKKVFDILERTAQKSGHDKLFGNRRAAIEDDHVPFNRIGIPSAVLIDLTFGPGNHSNAYWHTEQDTVDKLSPTSIETIGSIVLGSLDELAFARHSTR